MTKTKPVSCRLHPEIFEQLDEMAEERKTSKARIIEELIKGKVAEEFSRTGSEAEANPDLPEGVYEPDSLKHEYGVKWEWANRSGQNSKKIDYYDDLANAERRARRVKNGDSKTLRE